MMILYLFEGSSVNGEKRERLLRWALADYCQENRIEFSEDVSLERTSKGKPFFTDVPVDFSISHSGMMWTCLMADSPVGIDIQEMRASNYEKIARRFFSQEEADYVDEHGEEGFFLIWVRKEAYVKLLGTGMWGAFDRFSVVENGKIREGLDHYFFTEIEMGEGIKCVACTKKKEEILIRTMN